MGSLSDPKANRQPAYRRIADGLRNQILTGQLLPGQRLPAKPKLSEAWRASSFTIHTAVQALIKEGWIESIPSEGTYVAQFKNRFTCAGIYHGADIFTREQASFSRALHTCLMKELNLQGKDALVFVDSRPRKKQKTILPALADAILHRRIQCLIAPTLNDVDPDSLARITLPTAFTAHPTSSHQVNFDLGSFLLESVQSLSRQGCRSIGLISNLEDLSDRGQRDWFESFYPTFKKAVQAEGLATRDDWIRKPGVYLRDRDFERFGYEQFLKLWALPEKPAGLIVHPDVMARGTSVAILKLGSRVQQKMKFVFHCNAHFHFICPFPATWVISDESLIAKEFIRMIQKQFDGEKISPVLIPYLVEYRQAYA